MGLLSKVAGLVSKVAPILPGPVGKVVGLVAKLGSKVPGGLKTVGGAVATGAGLSAGAAIVSRRGKQVMIDPRTGRPFKRHHRTGLSGRDILGAQKVARVVRAFGFKPKYAKKKGRR